MGEAAALPLGFLAQDVRLKLRVAWASIGVAALLICVKLGTFYTTESVGVLSSLLDSLLDGLSAVVTLISIRQAALPPSYKYRFGKGKAEALAALAQAAFIIGSAVLLTVEVVNRIFEPPVIRHEATGMIVLGLSSIVVVALIVFQDIVVKRTESVAIQADLRHYLGDIGINIAVIAGLGLTLATGWAYFDSLFAFLIVIFLVVNGWAVMRGAFRLLLDREIGTEERALITKVVMAHPAAEGLHDLRTRNSGTAQFIELHLELNGSLTLNEAHDITDEIEVSLKEAFPKAEILIHQEPAGLDDQRLDQRIAEAALYEKQ
jgi:ferrous-iron efflux pump FieF